MNEEDILVNKYYHPDIGGVETVVQQMLNY